MQAFFEQLGAHEELAEALCELRHIPAPRFSDDQWRVLEATIALLPLAVAELRGVFGERETVDFAELTISADRALEEEREPTDLALALGQHIRHLLVDEFQDTSLSQCELFEKLTRAWDAGRRPHAVPRRRSDAVHLPLPRGRCGPVPESVRRPSIGRLRWSRWRSR